MLTAYGILDDTNSERMLSAVTNVATERHKGLIIDVTGLTLKNSSSLSALGAHILRCSDVPTVLVCETISGQKALRLSGIDENIPVHWRVNAAVAALHGADKRDTNWSGHSVKSAPRVGLEQWPTTPLVAGASR